MIHPYVAAIGAGWLVFAGWPAPAAASVALGAIPSEAAATAPDGPAPATPEPPLTVDDAEVSADRVTYDDDGQTLVAEGHVHVFHRGVHVSATSLRYDLRTRQGELVGPIHIDGGDLTLDAAQARFDLAAESGELIVFKGRWRDRAQFAGDRLELTPGQIKLSHGFLTPCMHPEPDLNLAAETFRYFPNAKNFNLSGDRVAVQVLGQSLVTLPYFNTTVGEHADKGVGEVMLPSFGFDAYQGFLTRTRFDFSLGESSRGTVPIVLSTARGVSAGIEHALGLGPGDVNNAFYVENPWVTGRGGLRSLNSYGWTLRDGSRWDLAADYRSDLNGQPVHRLPDLSYISPSLRLPFGISFLNDVRAGYLWEESSGQQATRLQWNMPISTPMWNILPTWQTWLTGGTFLKHYIFQSYGGGTVSWNHRQPVVPGLALSQTIEVSRVFGETPFIHDRVYDVERLRVGIDQDWNPALSTAMSASFSRLGQNTAFSVEDAVFSATYRWNCFALIVAYRPLITGVDVQARMLNF